MSQTRMRIFVMKQFMDQQVTEAEKARKHRSNRAGNDVLDARQKTTNNAEHMNDIVDSIKKEKMKIKLEILLLNHIFFQDDGVVSRKEVKKIKSYFSKYKYKFTKEDIKDINELINSDITQNDVYQYITNNNYNIYIINNALSKMKDICDGEKYKRVIDSIESLLTSN